MFLEKILGIVSLPHFVYDFSRKILFIIYSINWPNLFVWLPLLLEILGNKCIVIVCSPGCDVVHFEINFIFLIKPFFYMTKNQNKSWEQKEVLKRNKKAFLIIFKGLSVAKNRLRTESLPFTNTEDFWFRKTFSQKSEIKQFFFVLNTFKLSMKVLEPEMQKTINCLTSGKSSSAASSSSVSFCKKC